MDLKLFDSEEAIIRKLRHVARVHKDFATVRDLCQVFYDVLKMAHYATLRKSEGIRGTGHRVTLKRTEISRLFKLVHYYYSHTTHYKLDANLQICRSLDEGDVLRYFDNYLAGTCEDRFGRKILIDKDNGFKFLYKNKKTQRHEVSSEYYLPNRGKRLPWIKQTLQNTRNIYTRFDRNDREIMYIGGFKGGFHNTDCYMAVIARKYRKDKESPYLFKTAFLMGKYNALLKRLERYTPIKDVPEA